jgi:WD40 repeat protein
MLQDESVSKDGDLYIRSVCFSPDGKYLATGAEDKQIRVCYILSSPNCEPCILTDRLWNIDLGYQQETHS